MSSKCEQQGSSAVMCFPRPGPKTNICSDSIKLRFQTRPASMLEEDERHERASAAAAAAALAGKSTASLLAGMQTDEQVQEAIADYRGRMAPRLAASKPEETPASSVATASEVEDSASEAEDMLFSSFAPGVTRPTSAAGSMKGGGKKGAGGGGSNAGKRQRTLAPAMQSEGHSEKLALSPKQEQPPRSQRGKGPQQQLQQKQLPAPVFGGDGADCSSRGRGRGGTRTR